MNNIKQTLLTCIEIAKAKGIFFNENDLNNTKEYVENMPDKEELEWLIKCTNDLLDDVYKIKMTFLKGDVIYQNALKDEKTFINMKEKLEKQKELL